MTDALIDAMKNSLLAELADEHERPGIDLARQMTNRGYSWLAQGKAFEALRQLEGDGYVISRLSEPAPSHDVRCRLYRLAPTHEVVFSRASLPETALVPGVVGAMLRRASERGCLVLRSLCDGAQPEDMPHYSVFGDVRGMVSLLQTAGFVRRFPDKPPRERWPWWAIWKAPLPIEADDWWYRCDVEARRS